MTDFTDTAPGFELRTQPHTTNAKSVKAQSVLPPLVDESVVLTGPTASGKSAVAIHLAERIGGEILSLDSIAVYRRMDIGTAKPSAEQRERVPHHLVDLVEPDQDFSVACYLQHAHRLVREIRQRGRWPIFVGGTPMFLKAVLRGFDPGPPPDWEFRRSVEADLETFGAEALHARLAQADPLAAHRIDRGDTRRMIRALEVVKQTGVPLSHRQNQFEQGRSADQCRVFAFQWPRAQLHARINQRVDEMFSRGLIDEVRQLAERFGELSRTACQAVGYREILPHVGEPIEGKRLVELRELVAAHTRQLARRQETWFRSFSEITPVAVAEPLDAEAIANQLSGWDTI